ncbi:MAG: hypothetical protein ACYCW6_18050 [Candidatus Xenobia bacterium]
MQTLNTLATPTTAYVGSTPTQPATPDATPDLAPDPMAPQDKYQPSDALVREMHAQHGGEVADLGDTMQLMGAREHFADHPLSASQSQDLYRSFDKMFKASPSAGRPVGRIDPKSIQDPALRQLLGSGAAYRAQDESLHVGSLVVSRDGNTMDFGLPDEDGESQSVFKLLNEPDGVHFIGGSEG